MSTNMAADVEFHRTPRINRSDDVGQERRKVVAARTGEQTGSLPHRVCYLSATVSRRIARRRWAEPFFVRANALSAPTNSEADLKPKS